MFDQAIPAHKRIDKSDLFWLVYLIFFLIEPFARHSLPYWIESLGYVAIYIILYFVFLIFSDLRVRVATLAGMLFLGLWTYPHNGGGTCFVIYSAALIPFLTSSISWIVGALFAESAFVAVEGLWLHISPYSWFSGILLIITVGGSNIVFAQKVRADRKSRMQQEEIEALAAVAERERIARDLHDVLGHTLSVIVLKAELANRLLGRELEATTPDAATLYRAKTEIADVERTARTALAEVREAIGGYRARGLAAEIDAARNTLASAGVTLTTEGDLHPATLSAAEETVLALALREAVTNIVRHAQATACTLRVVSDRGRYRLSVEDNGQHPVTREGNGLRGMRERVESLGGQLSLSRETGTQLIIDLPQRALP